MPSRRTLTLSLTTVEYEVLASAVDHYDITLHDDGQAVDRRALERAWSKLNAAWHGGGGGR